MKMKSHPVSAFHVDDFGIAIKFKMVYLAVTVATTDLGEPPRLSMSLSVCTEFVVGRITSLSCP